MRQQAAHCCIWSTACRELATFHALDRAPNTCEIADVKSIILSNSAGSPVAGDEKEAAQVMKIACLTQPAIPVMATAPAGCELVEYTYENPFPIGRTAIQICDLIVAAAGIQAIEDGCDAIVINTLADFGAAILKDVARGPVVAAGYAAFAAAATLGSGRFSIVSIWPPATGLVVQERLREYGAAHDAALHQRRGGCQEARAQG